MLIRSKFSFGFFCVFFVFSNYSLAQNQCLELFSLKNETSALESSSPSSIDKTISQIEIRTIKLTELLENADPVTKRQGLKTIDKIHRLIQKISQAQDITDAVLSEMMSLMSHVEKLEVQLIEVSTAQLMDPLRLRRYLFTREPLDDQTTYFANLPGFDYVKIHFSKNVADYFTSDHLAREKIFPYIFKGQAHKFADSGLKALTQVKEMFEGQEWALWELKVIGRESRILTVYSNGELYFYKVILNHHRVDYGNLNYLKDFFKTLGTHKSD